MPKKYELPSNEELVSLFGDDVLKVCNFYLGKRSLAEDAFQDVFVKVILKRDSFSGDCHPKYWVLAIARNLCKDYLKSSWATRTGSLEQANEDSGEKQESSICDSSRQQFFSNTEEEDFFDSLPPEGELWDAIMQLPDAAKDIILLRYNFDMDNKAIAKQLHITESTVRSRLFRAKEKLKKFSRCGSNDQKKSAQL